jgi:hypothetical protein
VWHLQTGGNPSGDKELPDSWLSVPRWPFPPVDVVLAAEMVVYNFHPHVWGTLQADGRWLRLVQASEDFVLNHYINRIAEHFARRSPNRETTWLGAQDNASGWEPRPA